MRSKIALRNLFISQIIILIFLLFSYFAWFPYSFSWLGGFYETALMLIFVDLVLGPLLVFIVYKENKKHLKFDINVLLAIQLSAFVFGAYSLYLKHPTYVVFSGDRFTLVNKSQISPHGVRFDQLKPSVFSPTFVYAKLPDDSQLQIDFMLGVDLRNESKLEHRSDFYHPLETYMNIVLNSGIEPSQFLMDKSTKKILNKFIKDNGRTTKDYVFFPLQGNNNKKLVWAFEKETFKPVETLEIDPYKFKIISKVAYK
jgi:hypothetical protein